MPRAYLKKHNDLWTAWAVLEDHEIAVDCSASLDILRARLQLRKFAVIVVR